MALRVKKVETGYTDGKGTFRKAGTRTGAVKKVKAKAKVGTKRRVRNPSPAKYHGTYDQNTHQGRGDKVITISGGVTKQKATSKMAEAAPKGATKATIWRKSGARWFSVNLAGAKTAKANPNPLPVGKYIKAKVKRMANGDVKVLISR